MTDRERQFAALGWEYAEGIDLARVVIVPTTGREIRRVEGGWEAQPWNDNYWRTFPDLLDAARFATRPKAEKHFATRGTEEMRLAERPARDLEEYYSPDQTETIFCTTDQREDFERDTQRALTADVIEDQDDYDTFVRWLVENCELGEI